MLACALLLIVPPCVFQAVVGDTSKTDEQRRAARDALKKQAAEAAAIAQQLETEAKEKAELEAKITAMESKVGAWGGDLNTLGCTQ